MVDLGPLFEPRGVVVAGASTHPGKFGFVALHNILASGYQGKVFGTNLERETVLGIETVADMSEIPAGEADLVFVCTPAPTVIDVITAAAERGVTAAFVASGGFREAGEAGAAAERELIQRAEELGVILAGPNGQGLVSTPSQLCAQIVAPYPPAGQISVVSQSGNLVSTYLNLATQAGVGVARAISAGNASALGVIDYLEWFCDDDQTRVSLGYLEGLDDARSFYERARALTPRKPIVLVKGGSSSEGARAAASHTGSLATDDRVFDGLLRQAGIVRAPTVEAALSTAAAFATLPLPKGPRVVVLTTVGGWGVVSADAIASSSLELLELPADLYETIDGHLPPRWSRNNPVDMAGGEKRDTVPDLLRAVAGHPDVDAVIFLGMGIQSNTAAMLRSGPFYPDHGLERITDFHERQDARYAQAVIDTVEATGTPVLAATELAIADPNNPGPATLRKAGWPCFPSAQAAIDALDAMQWYSAWRTSRGQ